MSARPTVLTRCVAQNYAASCERIIEVSDRATGLGCLIRITRDGPDKLSIHVYRRDEGVEVTFGKAEPRAGKAGAA